MCKNRKFVFTVYIDSYTDILFTYLKIHARKAVSERSFYYQRPLYKFELCLGTPDFALFLLHFGSIKGFFMFLCHSKSMLKVDFDTN